MVVVVFTLALSFLIKMFLIRAFYIWSPSIESILIRGNQVVINKLISLVFDLKCDDVLVFFDLDGWLPAIVRTFDGRLNEGF